MSDNLSPCIITEIVCTRLSHDLIGNIGAVANAVEIINDDPAEIDDIKPILEISSQTLTARLKFFRLAFGLNNTAPKNTNEVQQIATDYISTIGSRQTPISLKININTPALYKIVLLSIMSLADVFIRGGILDIKETSQGLSIEAKSPAPLSASKLQTFKQCLSGKYPSENPAQFAPLLYMLKILETSPVKITLEYNEQQAILRIA